MLYFKTIRLRLLFSLKRQPSLWLLLLAVIEILSIVQLVALFALLLKLQKTEVALFFQVMHLSVLQPLEIFVTPKLKVDPIFPLCTGESLDTPTKSLMCT